MSRNSSWAVGPWAAGWVLALLLGLGLTPPASAQGKRVALVIGNAAYQDRPLRNPVNDAELMQRSLQSIGFDVKLVRNADRRAMLGALREFEMRAAGAEVALFFFAGHGAQTGGTNYLIPLAAPIRSETDLPDEAVAAESVLVRLEASRAQVSLVVLDACRDNPFVGSSRSGARGLARMSAPSGSIVAYATAAGSTADDGDSGNGTYTAALAKQLTQAGVDVKEVFERTAIEVERVTGGRQRPREDVGLRGRFELVPGNRAGVARVETPAPDLAAEARRIEDDTWADVRRAESLATYKAYLAAYPSGRYAAQAQVAIARITPAERVAAPVLNSTPSAPPLTVSGTSRYPERPLTMVVPFAPGGPVDRVARDLALVLGRGLNNQPITVENVGGAGGTLGASKVSKAPADGYWLLLHHIGMATSPALYRNLPYKTLDDFEFVGMVSEVPMTLVGRPNLPANSFAELRSWINANKGKINLANAGLGAASHLCGLLLQQSLAVDMTTVPYKGTGPAMTDLLGGQVDLMCDQTTNTGAQIQAGKVKAYAVTTLQPLANPTLARLPTLDSQGLNGFNLSIWHGLYAPKGTPKAVLDQINLALRNALNDPEFIKRQEALGAVVITDNRVSPAGHKKFVEAEIAKWGPAIKAAGQYAD